jgi:hypothetical protein
LQGRPSTTKGLWSCIMIFRAWKNYISLA